MIDIVKTKRLVLRPPVSADADVLAMAVNHEDIAKYILCPNPYQKSDADWFIADNAMKRCPAKGIFVDGELIGMIELDANFELGYWVTPAHWGKGYVTEASNALLERHFAQEDAPRVISGYQPSNQGSAAVQKKLGFVVDRRGKINSERWGELDHVDTVLTRDDWLAVRGLRPAQHV